MISILQEGLASEPPSICQGEKDKFSPKDLAGQGANTRDIRGNAPSSHPIFCPLCIVHQWYPPTCPLAKDGKY